MPQIFHPAMNSLARVLIVGSVVLALLGGVLVAYAAAWSNWRSGQYRYVQQPIPFSHEHHVEGLGIDCRYCHTSVETSSFAGIPPTRTCMTCHSKLWTEASLLAPVRRSWETRTPIFWTRVHDLPKYVYFDHSIHVNKGVGCSTCHGQVETMPLTYQDQPLQMRWCLQCHRDPAMQIRPRDQVFNMEWQKPKNQREMGEKLVKEYHIQTQQMTNCSVCHR